MIARSADHRVIGHALRPGLVGYRDSRTVPFGVRLLLPEPLGIELDTEKLKQYVD